MRLPAWYLALLGWTAGVGLAARLAPSPPGPVPTRVEALRPGQPSAVPGRPREAPGSRSTVSVPRPPPTPREWRGVPGIGRRRALDLSRAGWEAGPGALDPLSVPGVGEATAARVRAFLASRGAYTSPDDRLPDPDPPLAP